MSMVVLGNHLKELRVKAGLSQQQVADRTGLTKSMISYYELSDRTPSPEILVKLATLFHVSTDYLLGVEKKSKTLDVSDLTDEEIDVIQNMIDLLRKKGK